MEGAAFVIGVLALGPFLYMLLWLGKELRRERGESASAPELVEDVAELTGLRRASGAVGPGRGARHGFHGHFVRREAFLHFVPERVGKTTELHVHISMVADETPRLVVTEETATHRFRKLLGMTHTITIGDAEFDRRFRIEGEGTVRASQVLRSNVRRLIWELFDLGAERVSFERGWITASGTTRAIVPSCYRAILETLVGLSASLDRCPIKVKVLGGERRAHVDESGKTRCPYCHDHLTGEEPDLVACERCLSVVHDECWLEHGGCPLLGCEGRSVERARPVERG